MEIPNPLLAALGVVFFFVLGLLLFLGAQGTREEISNTFGDGSRYSRIMRRLHGVDAKHYVLRHRVGGVFTMAVALLIGLAMVVHWLSD